MEEMNQNDDLKKYKTNLVVFVCVIILLALLLSYLWFVIKGFLPIGDDLEKSDWLTFCAGFLSFTGSLVLGAVAIWQNKQAQIQAAESNKVSKRMLALQEAEYSPIFTVECLALPQYFRANDWRNTGDASSRSFFSLEDSGDNDYIYYACFDLLISNESKYPICDFSVVIKLAPMDNFSKDIFLSVNNPLYIKSNSNQKTRLSLPTTISYNSINRQFPDIITSDSIISIRISCRNAYGYQSDSELLLSKQPTISLVQKYRIIPKSYAEKK